MPIADAYKRQRRRNVTEGTSRPTRRVESGGALELLTEVAAEKVLFPTEQQHVRKRERLRVCDREERAPGAQSPQTTRGAAVKLQLRRAVTPDDLDVAPQHILGVARAERLHRRFFAANRPAK